MNDSWHSDAFAGASGDEKCPALTLMAARTLVVIVLPEWLSGLATTSSAARSGVVLECCHRSRCSFVGFAGSYLRRELMKLALFAGGRVEGVVGWSDLLVAAVAGLDRSHYTTSQWRVWLQYNERWFERSIQHQVSCECRCFQ